MLSGPEVEIAYVLVKVLDIDRMIGIPDTLLKGSEQRFEALGPVPDF